jgi:hypothetical protein
LLHVTSTLSLRSYQLLELGEPFSPNYEATIGSILDLSGQFWIFRPLPISKKVFSIFAEILIDQGRIEISGKEHGHGCFGSKRIIESNEAPEGSPDVINSFSEGLGQKYMIVHGSLKNWILWGQPCFFQVRASDDFTISNIPTIFAQYELFN